VTLVWLGAGVGCLGDHGRSLENWTEGRPEGSHCFANADCAVAQLCEYGFCRRQCEFSADCGEGHHCIGAQDSPLARICTLSPEEGCNNDRDCPCDNCVTADHAGVLFCGNDQVCREGCCRRDDPSCPGHYCPCGYQCMDVRQGTGVCRECLSGDEGCAPRCLSGDVDCERSFCQGAQRCELGPEGLYRCLSL
jgi:hypothetical protein